MTRPYAVTLREASVGVSVCPPDAGRRMARLLREDGWVGWKPDYLQGLIERVVSCDLSATVAGELGYEVMNAAEWLECDPAERMECDDAERANAEVQS